MIDPGQLLPRCRQGDELAWEVLVRQHQGRVCAMAYGYTGDQDEASDLAQEIFVRVYKSLDSCRDPEKFEPWLLRIVRNACVDHLRRQKARPPRQDIPAEEMHDLKSASPDPEQDWVRNSRKRLVFSAMQDLSEINREIILLKEIQGLPLEEIATLLELPLGTIKSRSSRARVELARIIAERGQGPDGSLRSEVAS